MDSHRRKMTKTGGSARPAPGPARPAEALEGRTLLSSPAIPRPDHVVVVVEEDHSYNQILGARTLQPLLPSVPVTLLAGAPYIQQLAANGASLTQMHSIGNQNHIDYPALFAGLDTTRLKQPYDAPNLATELGAAGLSLAGYSESLPHAGYWGYDVGDYKHDHNPLVYFSNVPASDNLPFSKFPSDFSKLPTVSFVIPNLQHDMHSGLVSTADQWLQKNIGPYADWAMSHNSLLIVTWDESHETGDQIPTIFYGPMIESGTDAQRANQFNLVHTIEDMYGLAPTNQAAQAAPLAGVFGTGGLTEPFEDAVLKARPRSRGDRVSLSGRVIGPKGKGLPGWWVYLDTNHDGALQPGEPIVLTGHGGRFRFKGLPADTYDARVVPQSGFAPTSPTDAVLHITIAAKQHIGGVLFSEQLVSET